VYQALARSEHHLTACISNAIACRQREMSFPWSISLVCISPSARYYRPCHTAAACDIVIHGIFFPFPLLHHQPLVGLRSIPGATAKFRGLKKALDDVHRRLIVVDGCCLHAGNISRISTDYRLLPKQKKTLQAGRLDMFLYIRLLRDLSTT
jgi:hypothetical protein